MSVRIGVVQVAQSTLKNGSDQRERKVESRERSTFREVYRDRPPSSVTSPMPRVLSTSPRSQLPNRQPRSWSSSTGEVRVDEVIPTDPSFRAFRVHPLYSLGIADKGVDEIRSQA